MSVPAATIQILNSSFDVDGEGAKFRATHKTAGAIVSFVGQVRDYCDDDRVNWLQLEHYPGVTESAIADISNTAQENWPLLGLTVIHRVGKVHPGEPIVFVAAASDHRRSAFRAVDFIMDYLKSAAPFWKQEATTEGVRWVEPRKDDIKDIARWRDAKSS